MKALDKVTDILKIRKAFSSPETCPWEQKAFLIFMVREMDEHHGAFGLGLGCSNAA